MVTLKQAEQIATKFKKMTDEQRWQWVIENKDIGLTIILDNGDTMIVFDGETEETDYPLLRFGDYNIYSLLDTLGIKNRDC